MSLASRVVLLLLAGAAAFSPAASAHGDADWLHGALDGAVLFFTALKFLLPILLLALLAWHHRLRPVIIQAAALGFGLLIALLGPPLLGEPSTAALYARGYLVALGLLVLSNLRLHTGLVLALGLATGTLTGLESLDAVKVDPEAGFAPSVGFLLAAICLYLPAALITSRYTGGWQRIALRVVASWIAAIAAIDIALMMGGY